MNIHAPPASCLAEENHYSNIPSITGAAAGDQVNVGNLLGVAGLS